ncbi:MAG: hypothetical protein ACK4SZ_15750 [Allosphingosinicella sp.]|uniref:hypothetical protein n=1 Tax=Allosphingosinicella sp. TaxID=2823234 RepID=UPI0039206DA4
MVAATKKKPAAKPATPKKVVAKKSAAPKPVSAAESAPAILKAFHHGTEGTENFSFSRFWWENDGARKGIKAKVLKKFQPKPGTDDDPDAVTAARADPLIPLDAQADYMDVRHLLERFDATMPAHETHAFVQVTLHFPEAVNMHAPWEEARAFAMDHFVLNPERRLAVVMAMHAPNLAASGSHLHVHLLIPLRRLGPLGWGEVERHLPNDRGRQETHAAWLAFRAGWATRLLGRR